MALGTFKTPSRPPRTFYVVAGAATGTVLDVAREHGVPIHHQCGRGLCGRCEVVVIHDSDASRKERKRACQLRISSEDVEVHFQ